jgi:xylulokinase
VSQPLAGDVVLGVDIGTSSSKGVIVDLDGVVLATAVREHSVSRPKPGWVEMDAAIWWDEFVSISAELIASEGVSGASVVAVGVS